MLITNSFRVTDTHSRARHTKHTLAALIVLLLDICVRLDHDAAGGPLGVTRGAKLLLGRNIAIWNLLTRVAEHEQLSYTRPARHMVHTRAVKGKN